MRFSFITCTYNRVICLSQTLQSLCAQTFDPKEYEILVVDNNSTDNTSEVVDRFRLDFPDRQIYYFKELNQGLSFALNRGIEEARGEYIVFVDDDETIHRNHLLRLANNLMLFPEALLIASPVEPIYEKAEPRWMSPFTQRLIGGYFNEGKIAKKLNKGVYPGTGHTVIKRELFKLYGLYNTELGRSGVSLIGAEDKDMFYRLSKNDIECYYFPNIPIFHHIPAPKLMDDFFNRLTYSIGKSERIRTQSVSTQDYRKRVFAECIKWGASMILCIFYFVTLRPSKGTKLLQFRWNVSKGLLGK